MYNVQCVSMSTGFSLGVFQKGTRGSNVTLVLPTMCPFGPPLYFFNMNYFKLKSVGVTSILTVVHKYLVVTNCYHQDEGCVMR